VRVVYIITRGDAIGGASIHVRDMASGVRARGGDAVVLVGGTGPVTDELAASRVKFEVIPSLQRAIRPWRDMAAVRETARALRRLSPDLVSTHTAKAGVVGRLAAWLEGIPALHTPHGLPVGDRLSALAGRVFGPVERALAPLARRIILVSEAERALALRHGIAEAARLAVVHNGVIDIPADLRARPEAEPLRMVSVARMEAPKDHATLLQALAHLRAGDWTLDLVGDGPLEGAIRARAQHLGLSGRVRFLGATRHVAQVLAEARLFVLSSRSEGFPRSILEAMRAGLPVVASRVGGVEEAVLDGATGMIVNPGDSAQLASALDRLARDPDLRRWMGHAGRKRYEQRFLFDRTFASTLRLYEETLQTAFRPAMAGVGGD
jgi:glycosyltransferase involved in cell wall biosynthesis